jgi:hypothetical protein
MPGFALTYALIPPINQRPVETRAEAAAELVECPGPAFLVAATSISNR